MSPRTWLGRAGAAAGHLLLHLRGLGVFFTGPLPGVHYDDLDTGFDHPHRRTSPGPPPGHPERHCTTPPSRRERELWASLGIDTERTGS